MAISDTMMKRCQHSAWYGDKERCRWCNAKLTGRQKRWCSSACSWQARINHWYPDAKKVAIARDGRKCSQCGSTRLVEVNHIKPALGRHDKASCIHHPENLILLCREHHLLVTAEQRRRGMLKRGK